MATTTRKRRGCSVTGPGIERDGSPNVGAAVSLALTLANAADAPGTFYVRDSDGHVVAHVDRQEHRITVTSLGGAS